MDGEVDLIEISLRSLGEMIVEILQNEGISATMRSTSFFSSAYLTEGGYAVPRGPEWKIVVPADEAEKARAILEQLQQAGEELDFEPEPIDDR